MRPDWWRARTPNKFPNNALLTSFWKKKKKKGKTSTLTQVIREAFRAEGEKHCTLTFFTVCKLCFSLILLSTVCKEMSSKALRTWKTKTHVMLKPEYNFSWLNPYYLSGFIILMLLQKCRYCSKYHAFFYTNRCYIHECNLVFSLHVSRQPITSTKHVLSTIWLLRDSFTLWFQVYVTISEIFKCGVRPLDPIV